MTAAERVRKEHRVQDAMDAMMDGPAESDPIAWPEEVPSPYTPDEFRKVVTDILRECAVPAELVLMDCTEPPCIAALRLQPQKSDREFLGDCPLWQEAYGGRTKITQAHKEAACANGSLERVAFVHRFWPAIYDQYRGQMLRRIRARVSQLRDGWDCRP